MQAWVTLARIARPHGIRGEVVADGDRSTLEHFIGQAKVFLHPPGEAVRIETVRPHDGRLLVKLSGVNTMNAAERLRGCEMRVRLEDRPPAGPSEYYLADLVGCRLIELASGTDAGEVTGWQSHQGTVLLEVSVPGMAEPMLVPFAAAICREVDVAGRRIMVELPEGLKDLG